MSTVRRVAAIAFVLTMTVACASEGGVGPTAGTSSPAAVPTSVSTTRSSGPGSTGSSPAPTPPGPIVIAHRGASGYAPEHTFASYDLAVEKGADYLEQDLQLTADGVLVVLHDATLDRTARGPAASCTGPVSEKTLAQVQELSLIHI